MYYSDLRDLGSYIVILIQFQLTTLQASRLKNFFVYTHAFFQYNRRILRQKEVGPCLDMPQDGHWQASFEVIPSHTHKSWFYFRGQKFGNFPLKTALSVFLIMISENLMFCVPEWCVLFRRKFCHVVLVS